MTETKPKALVRLKDGLANLYSRLGTTADRSTANVYVVPVLPQEQIEAAYRSSWLTRKVHDLVPFEMTRAGRNWKAEKEVIKKLREHETKLKVWSAIEEALQLGRLHGGGAIILGVAQGQPDEELQVEKVTKGSLRYLYVVSRHQLYVSGNEFETDPESDHFGKPKMWELRGGDGQNAEIHPSRVITFHGAAIPKAAAGVAHIDQFWGDPLLMAIKNALENADTAQGAVASLLHELKQDTISIPGLTEKIATGEAEDQLTARIEAINVFKSMFNTLLLDGGDEDGNGKEEWNTRELSFSQHPELIQTFLGIVAGASDIPITRLLGQSPGGLQSTGKGEQRDFNRMVSSKQTSTLTPNLAVLDEVLIRSATGARDLEDISYEYGPLDEPDEVEASEIEKREAETVKIYADTAMIPSDALAKAATARMTESGRWPGLDEAIEESAQELGEIPEPEAKAVGSVQEMEAQGAITGDQALTLLADTAPRTLYVSRPVLNAAEVIKWAKAQGFGQTVSAKDMHVTVIHSDAPVDWMEIGGEFWAGGNENGELKIPPGGPRIVEPLGNDGGIVLFFASSELTWRHEGMVRAGAQEKHDAFMPHITITYSGEDAPDLNDVEPYRGKIRLGPEKFEEVTDEWASEVIEK